MGYGTVFLPLALLVVTVRGQACEVACNASCGVNGLTREGNIVNIAFNKTAGMSSVWNDDQGMSGAACMAVNGNTSPLYRTLQDGDPNCVHTGKDDYAPSWYVDLGRQYTITNITIYERATARHRMAGLRVLVGNDTTNQTCYSFPNTTGPALNNLSAHTNITCDPPLIGSRVWLKKHGQDTYDLYFINVCEVQVWGCREGYTGVDCKCRHCKDDMSCNDTIKTCPNGCDSGWQENDYCDQPCANGTYGDGCNDTCGNCTDSAVCDKVNGTCPSGCQPGFNPSDPLCNTECHDNFYGEKCQSNCSNCAEGSTCDKVNGTCPSGCKPGFNSSEPLCAISCSGTTYGKDCSGQCGLCKDGEACDAVTGHCSACQTKLLAPLCQVCEGNRHGSSCENMCSDLCGGDGSCDRNSSMCVQGCVTGYVLNGSSCEPCSNKTYGEDCGGQCGLCKDGEACDMVTGHCSACQPNLQVPLCQVEIEDTGLDIVVVAGAAGAGLVVLLVIAVVLFVVIRRKRLSRKEEQQARYQSPEATSHLPGAADTPYDVIGMYPVNAVISGPGATPTDSNGTRKSQKPMVAVKPTVKPTSTVNTNDDSSNIYYNIGNSIDPSELEGIQASNQPSNQLGNPPSNPPSSSPRNRPSNPPETSRRQASAAIYFDPEEYEDESPLAEGGHVYANEDDADVYASFKASEPRIDSVQKYLVDRLATGGLVAEFSDIKKAPDGVVQQVGLLPENREKNRFKKILPYDRNRIVLLDGYTEDSATDYVNASYVTRYYSTKQFIAAQGPLLNIVGDFWRMVWEEKTGHIVMLTNVLENGRTKCEQYWPEEEGATQTYGPVTVTTTDIQCRDDFFVRTFRIKRNGSNQSREVIQYHFTAWPDHGVPTTTSLVTFCRYVSGRTASSGERATAPPVVVHCSAGVGRTGTYIGLDIGIEQAVKDGTLDVLGLVTYLREERCLMVQTVEQYTFLHKTLLEAYTAHGTNMSVDTFEGLFPRQIVSGSPHPRLDKEFRTLQQMLTLQPEQRLDFASLEENIAKNRDRAVLPSDSHLVYLNEYVAGQNQYINAVFMPTFRDSRGCVVTQLPLPDTLVDFWRLVYGSDITTVVSLSAPNEDKEVKPYCQYWPTKNGGSVKSGPYDVTLMSKNQLPGSEVTTYSLKLAKKDVASAKSLQLLHYKGWTGEVGGSSSDILHLIDILVTSHLHTNRLVVQCSDGVKKSGLFCTLLDVINRMTYDREVDVYMTIRHVQSVTPKAITSAVQYRYCYEVVQRRVREMVSIYGNAPAR